MAGNCWNFHDDTWEFIATSLGNSVRRGGLEALHSGEDVLLIEVRPDCRRDAPRLLVEAARPASDRVLVALSLGTGPAGGKWEGVVWQTARLTQLAELRLVGPGMHRFPIPLVNGPGRTSPRDDWPGGSQSPDSAGTMDNDRWSRTRGALGDSTWRKLRACQVAVVGAGRTGSGVALALGQLGIRRLVLIDPDRDESHNRDATALPEPMELGRPKVFNRRTALDRLLPGHTTIDVVADSIAGAETVDRLRPVDLIVTAVDHDEPRLVAAVLANRWAKPHLDLGTGVLHGAAGPRMGAEVRFCLPGEACVSCLGGLRDHEEAEYALAAPRGALRRGPFLPWNVLRAGSLLTVNQIAVHLGVQLWIDLLAGRLERSTWYHLGWGEDGVADLRSRHEPSPDCRYCRPRE